MLGWSPREVFWWCCLGTTAGRGETGYFVTCNRAVVIRTDEQDMFFYCSQGIYGEYSVASLGTEECGVYILVSMTVKEDVCAKCLQGTSSLHPPEYGVLVASLINASEEGNVHKGWWEFSSLYVARKNFSSVRLLLKYILHSALIKRTVGRTVVFFCNCWVRRGWRWETQGCHSGPMGKQFATWHNSFFQYLSSGSSLYGLATLSTFH